MGKYIKLFLKVSALPQVSFRFGRDFDCVSLDDVILGLPCPLEIVDIQCHNLVVLFYVLLAFAVVVVAACRHKCQQCERNDIVFHCSKMIITDMPYFLYPMYSRKASTCNLIFSFCASVSIMRPSVQAFMFSWMPVCGSVITSALMNGSVSSSVSFSRHLVVAKHLPLRSEPPSCR